MYYTPLYVCTVECPKKQRTLKSGVVTHVKNIKVKNCKS